MKQRRVDIGSIRRAEIVAASARVIAERGIQHLSLSEIEKKVGMSRGQLLYYYRTKEDILLAVFDRLIQLMCEQHGEPGPEHPFSAMDFLAIVKTLLELILRQPPAHPEFHALQYTFLSQVSHRKDFGRKLAELYERWRGQMSGDLRRQLRQAPACRSVSPRAVASLVQAILHGYAVQTAAAPGVIKPRQAIPLVLEMLSAYLWNGARPEKKPKTPKKVRGHR